MNCENLFGSSCNSNLCPSSINSKAINIQGFIFKASSIKDSILFRSKDLEAKMEIAFHNSTSLIPTEGCNKFGPTCNSNFHHHSCEIEAETQKEYCSNPIKVECNTSQVIDLLDCGSPAVYKLKCNDSLISCSANHATCMSQPEIFIFCDGLPPGNNPNTNSLKSSILKGDSLNFFSAQVKVDASDLPTDEILSFPFLDTLTDNVYGKECVSDKILADKAEIALDAVKYKHNSISSFLLQFSGFDTTKTYRTVLNFSGIEVNEEFSVSTGSIDFLYVFDSLMGSTDHFKYSTSMSPNSKVNHTISNKILKTTGDALTIEFEVKYQDSTNQCVDLPTDPIRSQKEIIRDVSYPKAFILCIRPKFNSNPISHFKIAGNLVVKIKKEQEDPFTQIQTISNQNATIPLQFYEDGYLKVLVQDHENLRHYQIEDPTDSSTLLPTEIQVLSYANSNLTFTLDKPYFIKGTDSEIKIGVKADDNFTNISTLSPTVRLRNSGNQIISTQTLVLEVPSPSPGFEVLSFYKIIQNFSENDLIHFEIFDGDTKNQFVIPILKSTVDTTNCNTPGFWFDTVNFDCTNSCNMLEDSENRICHQFCGETCLDQSSECIEEKAKLVFDDNTCGSTCNSPLFNQDGKKCTASCNGDKSFGDTNSGNCVEECSTSLYTDSQGSKCYFTCPSNLKTVDAPGNKQCVSACEGTVIDTVEYKFTNETHCQTTCERAAVMEGSVFKCIGECENSNTPYIGENRLCTSSCPDYIDRGVCVSTCPIPTEFDAVTKTCLTGCPRFRSGDACVDDCFGFVVPQIEDKLESGLCVDECPQNRLFYYDYDKLCRKQCLLYYSANYECKTKCEGYIEINNDLLFCKDKCEEPKMFLKARSRDICGIPYTGEGEYLEINTVKYTVPLACYNLLNSTTYFTDNQCRDKCLDSSAKSLSISENICLQECPEETPYSLENSCLASCPLFYTKNKQCLSNCTGIYKYTQRIENKDYCLEECENGYMSDENNICFEYIDLKCFPPRIQRLNQCVFCENGLLFEEGKCVSHCSDGYLHNKRGSCLKCEGVNSNKECKKECNKGQIALVSSNSVLPFCVDCTKKGYFLDNEECVKKCPIGKIARDTKCLSCDQLGTYATEQEELLCEGCKLKFIDSDGNCLESCLKHSYSKTKQKYCLDCGKDFFFEDKCVEECPNNTVIYLEKRICLRRPSNCAFEGHLCLRQSRCRETIGGVKCDCRKGTTGLFCQMLSQSAPSELNIDTITSWNGLSQVNFTLLENTQIIIGDSIEDISLVNTLVSLADEAFKLDKTDDFFKITDFALKYASFATKDQNTERQLNLIEKINSIEIRSKRQLSESNKIEFEGEQFSFYFTDDLGNKADLSKCTESLKTKLNLPTASFEYKLIQFNSDLAEISPPPTENELEISTKPNIKVSIYLDNQPQPLSEACSLSNIDLQFEVPPQASPVELDKLKDQGINPFDKNDSFFVDICSLSNKNSDLTLSKRKETYFINPAEQCNQQEGQVCTVKNFTGTRIECDCKGINNSPPNLNESFLTTFSESNFRLFRCYTKVFSRKMHKNPGFILSFGTFLLFYVLQNISLYLTLSRLKGKYYSNYIKNSMLVLQNTDFTAKEYFSMLNKRKPGISIVIESDNQSFDQEMGSPTSKRVLEQHFSAKKEDSTDKVNLPFLQKNLLTLNGVAPTNLDFDSLSVEEQLELDKRTIWEVFKVNLLRTHAYFNSFSFDYLLVPMHIRLFMLMSMIMVNLSLNALFYSDVLINNRSAAKEQVLR